MTNSVYLKLASSRDFWLKSIYCTPFYELEEGSKESEGGKIERNNCWLGFTSKEGMLYFKVLELSDSAL